MRLLELWPDVETAQIRCSLHIVDLLSYDDRTAESTVEKFKSFDAVSYVWGKRSKKVDIICDDRTMRITANLADALHTFRHLEDAVILWVDALCINQKDVTERSEQVQLMGLIYFKARQVRIWLGLDDEPVFGAQRAATLIRNFVDTHRRTPQIPARVMSEELFKHYIETDDMDYYAVARLLDHEWFRRVWVVQEFGLSRKAVFYCGETTIAKEDLHDFVRLLEVSRPGMLASESIDRRMIFLGQRYSQAAWGDSRIDLGSSPLEAETFLDILSATRGLRCTDRRDTIYAFLGHPSAFKQHRLDAKPYLSYPQNYYDSTPPIIKPDYDRSMTFLRACTELAINAIKDRGLGIQVLQHISHFDGTLELEVPSWVPLWDIWEQAAPFHQCDKLYHASGSLEPRTISVYTPSGNPCQSRLCLRAIKLANIRYAMTRRAAESTRVLAETLFPEQFEEAGHMELPALVWPDATSRVRNNTNEWSAFAMTLTAGLITTNTHLVPVPAEQYLSQHVAGLETYLRHYKHGPPHISDFHDNEVGENFLLDLCRAASSRIFYVTSRGEFGLAPMVTQVGDQVWLPLGASMPFIFRPYSHGVYQILGQTYLHGLMTGKAVEGRTADNIVYTYLASPYIFITPHLSRSSILPMPTPLTPIIRQHIAIGRAPPMHLTIPLEMPTPRGHNLRVRRRRAADRAVAAAALGFALLLTPHAVAEETLAFG
ncbi:hypothetical protein OPT61_g5870 [Boeremia exigua]|uniref:Uncharacterized protein n=1 Tax=Boeremia exigua TaxID=749465 RepID=A0ACC2I8Q5_9PLEO|nr:hypothetical protein OPT61_g5870 [Boeremia exigua]